MSDYTLSGTLEEGTSTITVIYGGKTDTFDVTVTQEILFSLENYAKQLGYIDTGVALMVEDIDFTIAIDVSLTTVLKTQSTDALGTRPRLFIRIESVSPWDGINCGKGSSNSNAFVMKYGNNYKTMFDLSPNTTPRIRALLTHTKGSGMATAYARLNSGSVATQTLTSAFKSIAGNIFIAGVTEEQDFEGTINSAIISKKVYSNSEINAFMGV